MILVDSSVWVRSLRREASRERIELDALLERDQVATTDIIVAEVLQGARSEADFHRLEGLMEGLHFFHADEASWRQAAEMAFELKRQGQTTALSDLVIAAVALGNGLEVYSIDSDFERVPGLRLHRPV